ncbi:unnamed protein product [Phaedon cochleariae]|uniref:Uncharacterized protein n=1 Tax=Phaedon cochleariae TaxID=80249 RepID=A0A9P0DG14_PHACE|nr:unnamed protein product [Phaedon cochleariae]
MTQRLKNCPNSINLETIACERYMARLFNKEKVISPGNKCREKTSKSLQPNQNQLARHKIATKQQNFHSPKVPQSPQENAVEAPSDKAPVNTDDHRQRSRSTTVDREPWGQLLKQQRSGDKASVFGNFDPLRTLHFLAKELQFQLQAVIPEDNTVHQMVADMQYALKRVPPEVASSVHLQQALELLPKRSSSRSLSSEKPEKLGVCTNDRTTQTPPSPTEGDNDRLQKLMEENTMKLETNCRQMEKLCLELKDKEDNLSKQLLAQKNQVVYLEKKIADLELENNEILHPRIKILEEEKRKLDSDLRHLSTEQENRQKQAVDDLKSRLSTLKTEKSNFETECTKLKHQLKLSALEKEKYVAVLALRDRQINEIRNEMTHLQEVVNEQLLELQNNMFQGMPMNNEHENAGNDQNDVNFDINRENIGDGTLSTIYSSDGQAQQIFVGKQDHSFRDLPSGDISSSIIQSNMPEEHTTTKNKKSSQQSHEILLEKIDSQASIRNMFNQVKKTAYAISSSTPKGQNLYNLGDQ